ncbi:3-dehydroquinate synthase [Leeia oryzae]|uniref:3-dehydroquinate synthase n=1 Tax=Leeia oryzae TaxID=356662 RepID=UPI00036A899E|nr:3-dehydroquinate synthase [Leeia oryzae]
MTEHISLHLDLGERSYPILIGKDLLAQLPVLLKGKFKSKHAMIVTNETVAPLYLEAVLRALQAMGMEVTHVVLPDGEQYKDSQHLDLIYSALLAARCDRKTTLVALGGGVVGDMTGYAAATYMRGIPFIQIPTTLLSQVDSSVGGKTGINHPLGKNMIGAFYQPKAVVADVSTLMTLPDREFSAGLAEVIKYGLIDDLPLFEWLEQNMARLMSRDIATLTEAVAWCCRNKARIVAADETEGGVRALLNLGHTFGHAIEAGMGYGVWLHGEAVAAGMMLAAAASQEMGLLRADELARIKRLLEAAGLPVAAPSLGVARYIELMQVDKKNDAGRIRFIMMRGLANAFITDDVSSDVLNKVLS